MRYSKWLSALCAAGLLCLQTGLAQAAPQSGWWWNPNQSGRGFTIEIQGNALFMAGYLYEDDGRASWLISGGVMQSATTYQGRLSAFSNGQTLTGPYQAPAAPTDVGAVSLQFSDDTHGTLTLPGVTIPIERFRYSAAAAAGFQPQTGWWWNPNESGRGFFMEVQGDKMFMAGYMYDANGKPVWYVSGGALTSPTSYQGNWDLFANGQTLTGSYQPPDSPVKVGAVKLAFTGPDQAALTLPDGAASVNLQRFRFGGGGDATPAGTPNGPVATQSIGPAGGLLASADGRVTLTIPQGALSSTVTFTIQPITNKAHGGFGNAYRLGPEGQTFTTPVQIAFQYDDQDLSGTVVEALGVAFQDAQGFWRALKSVNLDQANKKLTVSTTHFSDWSRLVGFQLIPAAAPIRVGKSLGLSLVFCRAIDIGDELVTLVAKCEPESGDFTASGWAVNATPGGNGTIGTVVKAGDFGATYTAPAKKPTPKVVAVSAQLDGALQKYLLVSNITIDDDDSWTGTVSSESPTSKISATAQVTWILESSDNNISYYRPKGSVSARSSLCSIDPSSGTIDPAGQHGELTIDYNATPPTYHGSGSTSWQATWTCPNTPPFSFGVSVSYFGGSTLGVEAQGVISPDGVTIEGSDTSALGSTFTWKFTRN